MRLQTFYTDEESLKTHLLRNDFACYSCSQLTQLKEGELNQVNQIYGQNIMEIPEKTIPELLFDEILTPFNLFQVFALIVWIYDDYVFFALLIFALTMIQIIFALLDLQESMDKIRRMILHESDVQRLAGQTLVHVSSRQLVPGDCIVIQDHQVIPCDCILIQGECIINEAILTGESVPVNKVQLPSTSLLFDAKKFQNSLLYCGTTCLKSMPPCSSSTLAIVYQTGFQTLKGGLARSILFTRVDSFSFRRDSLSYLFVLAGFGIIFGFLTFYVQRNHGIEKAVINGLEILTIIVPPTLPTALGAGLAMSIKRLERMEIRCIAQDKVNVVARTNMIGFDKTGTLTESELELHGFVGVERDQCLDFQRQISAAQNRILAQCLATCHSLSLIRGRLDGDPIDLKVFEASGWNLLNGEFYFEDKKLTVVKRFDFIAELQRMSVLVDEGIVFCKGSPEILKNICLDVPSDFTSVLNNYTSQGYRVLACAYKRIDDFSQVEREFYEKDLRLLGLIVFANKIKPESKATIETLQKAKIKVFMVTGDNQQTALSVSQQVSIIDSNKPTFLAYLDAQNSLLCRPINDERESHPLLSDFIFEREQGSFQLVMNGEVFRVINQLYQDSKENRLISICKETVVFSRMKPNDKGNLMSLLKEERRNIIGFCGDGTNDTCALKTADVGLSLSLMEASLAAPFTSRVFNISSFVLLLQQGRACLTTSVECFKFMTVYSCVQSVAVLQCFFLQGNMTESQYLYQDLWLILPMAGALSLSKPHQGLSQFRPLAQLVSLPILVSVIGFILMSSVFQITAFKSLLSQPFFLETDQDLKDDKEANYLNSMNIYISNSYIIAAGISFTLGYPFREPLYKNGVYMATITTQLVVHFCFLVYAANEMLQRLQVSISYNQILTAFPEYFLEFLIRFSLYSSLVLILYEKVLCSKLRQFYQQSELQSL